MLPIVVQVLECSVADLFESQTESRPDTSKESASLLLAKASTVRCDWNRLFWMA